MTKIHLSRRQFGLGSAALGALALSACGGVRTSRSAAPNAAPNSARSALPDDLRPAPNAAYDRWVAAFKPRARAQGISSNVIDTAFRNAGFLPGVVRRDRNQTEFKRSLEDYLAIAASEERVTKGRANYARHRNTLLALERRYGVSSYIIAAIWGLESFYGERRGQVPVISATSTLAFDGRRGAFFEKQLIAALRILQNGDISARAMVGSWAGAMGHTQFIPTSYQQFAVDFTGDGRRDIWSDDPSDALASTAAYLERNGWQRGLNWGSESASGSLQPQQGGPRFATTANFRAIKRYNNSDAYAIGVGHLSDRIRGEGPLRTPFPPDANGLTKSDRIELQKRLTARGFDTQGADGVTGPNTQRAIRAYQRSRGLPQTGTPSQELLKSLSR